MLMDDILKGLKKRGYIADSTRNVIPLMIHPMNKCSIGTTWMGLINVRQMRNLICPLFHLAGNIFSDKSDNYHPEQHLAGVHPGRWSEF